MLNRFDLPELLRQQQVLGALEEHMKCHQGQPQSQSQTRSQGQGIVLAQELFNIPAEGPDVLPPRPVDRAMANKMRNRRATLRKQRLRVEERIAQLMNTNNNANADSIADTNDSTDPNLNLPTCPNVEIHSSNTTDLTEEIDDVNHSGGITSATSTPVTTKSATPHHPHLVSLDDPLANPKTRLGWGFWQN